MRSIRTLKFLSRRAAPIMITNEQPIARKLTPFLNILLMISGVNWSHIRVADDKALHFEAFCNDQSKILDAIGLFWRAQIVLRYHTASYLLRLDEWLHAGRQSSPIRPKLFSATRAASSCSPPTFS